jgi:hypothetical protein
VLRDGEPLGAQIVRQRQRRGGREAAPPHRHRAVGQREEARPARRAQEVEGARPCAALDLRHQRADELRR